MKRLILLVAVLLAGLVIATCGGDSGDGDSNGSGESISREEFIERADAICATGDEVQDELTAQLQNATSPEEAADVYEQLADRAEETIAEITALPSPDVDAETIDELAAIQTEGVALVRRLADAVRANDAATGEEIVAQLEQSAQEGDRGDEGFGFQVC